MRVPRELMRASTDDPLRLITQAHNDASGVPEATEHDLARLRDTLGQGGLAALAALAVDTATGIGVGRHCARYRTTRGR